MQSDTLTVTPVYFVCISHTPNDSGLNDRAWILEATSPEAAEKAMAEIQAREDSETPEGFDPIDHYIWSIPLSSRKEAEETIADVTSQFEKDA